MGYGKQMVVMHCSIHDLELLETLGFQVLEKLGASSLNKVCNKYPRVWVPSEVAWM